MTDIHIEEIELGVIEPPQVDEIKIPQDPRAELTPERISFPTPDPQQIREETAGRVAHLVVVFFGVFLLLVFFGGLLALWMGLRLDGQETGPGAGALEATSALLESYGSLVENIGKVGTALFGPLLGFILGHYFGRGGGKSGR